MYNKRIEIIMEIIVENAKLIGAPDACKSIIKIKFNKYYIPFFYTSV
jgi:hypothetical protein